MEKLANKNSGSAKLSPFHWTLSSQFNTNANQYNFCRLLLPSSKLRCHLWKRSKKRAKICTFLPRFLPIFRSKTTIYSGRIVQFALRTTIRHHYYRFNMARVAIIDVCVLGNISTVLGFSGHINKHLIKASWEKDLILLQAHSLNLFLPITCNVEWMISYVSKLPGSFLSPSKDGLRNGT